MRSKINFIMIYCFRVETRVFIPSSHKNFRSTREDVEQFSQCFWRTTFLGGAKQWSRVSRLTTFPHLLYHLSEPTRSDWHCELTWNCEWKKQSFYASLTWLMIMENSCSRVKLIFGYTKELANFTQNIPLSIFSSFFTASLCEEEISSIRELSQMTRGDFNFFKEDFSHLSFFSLMKSEMLWMIFEE